MHEFLLLHWVFQAVRGCKSCQRSHVGGGTEPTFKMEEHVRLIVLEHLCDQLDVHVLDVDFLRTG